MSSNTDGLRTFFSWMNRIAARAARRGYGSCFAFVGITALAVLLFSLSVGQSAPATGTMPSLSAPQSQQPTTALPASSDTLLPQQASAQQIKPHKDSNKQDAQIAPRAGKTIEVATAETPNNKTLNDAPAKKMRNVTLGAADPDTSVKTVSVSSAANQSTMQATIQRVSDASRKHMRLTVGRGLLIDLSEPLKRASVADPNIADVSVLSPLQVLVTGKAIGTTEVILWDNQDRQVVFEVTVEMDLSEIKEAISRAAPGSQVDVRAVRDTVILSGLVADVDAVDRITEIAKILTPNIQNQLRVAGEQQVLLRCTVAEVSKQAARQLGVNGWIAGDNVRDMFAVNQLDGINPVNIGGAPTANIIQPGGIPFATDVDGLPLLPPPTGPELSLGFPRIQMQLFFRALRENNLLRVLAEPNLVALSGQEASFLAGGEFPVPVPQGGANSNTITIEYREFGVQLTFQPTVIGRQMIRLKVAPEVSEPDFTLGVVLAGTTVPGLSQRRAETTIELAAGSTIAIAGLLSERVVGIARQVPGLGDVPVLGALFRSVNYQKNQTELVILVTPELVSAMHPDQVPTVPGHSYQSPDDFELFGLGLLEGEPAIDETEPAAALETDIEPRYRKFQSPPEQLSLHGPWGHAERWETTP